MSIAVVTGGAGFIGSHLVLHLTRSGHTVRILDNLTGTGARDRVRALTDFSQVSLIEGDIRDFALCQAACDGAEVVYHQAAEASVVRSIEDPSTCVAINLGGTVNMLRASATAGVRRFVYASTCAVYGDNPETPKTETSPTDPLSPYAISKLAGEYFCRNFFQLHGLETVALRYFNVYGAGQDPNGAYAAVVPRFMTNMVRNHPLIIFGDGEQSRDFVHVQDIVDANVKAASTDGEIGGKVVNVGSGQGTSLNELVQMLEQITGAAIRVEYRDARAGDIKHSRADITAANTLLGYSPTLTLDTGLARTLQFYQSTVAGGK